MGDQILYPKQERILVIAIYTVLFINILFWFSVRTEKEKWLNVPPAPSVLFASVAGLGDFSFAYRLNGLMIQNFGDTGGQNTALKDYNFERLGGWFLVQDSLDAHSDFTPYLAAYYFGGSQDPSKLLPVIQYLEDVGVRSEGEKWRWMAQGVFLARFKMQDMDYALKLARKLAGVNNPKMPEWARQMPAFVMSAKGDKEAAYALMLEILKTRADRLSPEEVNAMRYYICANLVEKSEVDLNPLCKDLP